MALCRSALRVPTACGRDRSGRLSRYANGACRALQNGPLRRLHTYRGRARARLTGIKMSDRTGSLPSRWPVLRIIEQIRARLEAIPYALLAIPLRLALATVFWDSAMAHLANWQTTLELFETEYQVPIIPYDIAAYLAVSIEVTTPILLVLGLLTRLAAAALFGMVAVIEIFVYPE